MLLNGPQMLASPVSCTLSRTTWLPPRASSNLPSPLDFVAFCVLALADGVAAASALFTLISR